MTFITDLISKITNFRVKVGDKLNTLKSQIGQINSLTTNDKTSLVGAVNEVNNIQIGGRNYVLNSSTPTFNIRPYGAQITNTIVDYNSRKVTHVKSVGGSNVLKVYKDLGTPKQGEVVSVSFRVKTLTKPVRLASNQGGRAITIEANTEQYVKWEGIVGNGTAIVQIQLRTLVVEETLDLYIWDIKREVGNKATDWTPALEDQVSDWAETDSNSLSFIKGKEIIDNQLLNLVPYTGANKAVDLNTQKLTIGGDFEKRNVSFEKSYLDNSVSNSTHFTRLTDVASFSRGNDSTTTSDCIVITLPIRVSTRWVMEVDIFSPSTSSIFSGAPTKLLISAYSISNTVRSVTAISSADNVKSVSFCRDINNNTIIIIRSNSGSNFNYGKVNITNFYHGVSYSSDLAVKTNYKVDVVLESSLTDLTTNGTITNEQFTRDSYLWDKGNFNPEQYVLQTSLNTQLANYVPINGVTTINNTKTFTSSPIVPNATLDSHAVNLGQLNSLLPTVNDGKLTLTTGTGLNGSTNFTANQSSNSIFDVSIASTHKLPSTAEWNNTLKKNESNTVTENFEITNGTSKIKLDTTFAISGELVNESEIFLGSDDGFAVSYYTNNGDSFFSGVYGIQGYMGGKNWHFINYNEVISRMLMPETGDTQRVLTTGAKVGATTYYANNQGVIELPEYLAYTAGNGLTLSGTVFSLPVTTSGSGNVVSSVTQTANGISVSKGISAMTTSHVANGITATNISNWNTAFTNSHTHSNKSFLDTINQDLSKSSKPTFNSIELSALSPYIDFHYGNAFDDYTSRIIETDLGHLQNVVNSKFSVLINGQSTPLLDINESNIIIGQYSNPDFESISLNTIYGSLDFDDEGLNYRPKNSDSYFNVECNLDVLKNINGLKLKGRGSLGNPVDIISGNGLAAYVLGDNNSKNGLGTFRVDNTISKNGVPVFSEWGASLLVQSGDTMFTLNANPFDPEIYVSGGGNGNNVTWNKKLAFSTNEFPLYAQAFYENSLRELKENIKPFNKSGLELINSLDIVTFDRKDSEVKNKIGIIADDSIEEVLSTKKDAVDLYNTVFIQAKAIQELSEEVVKLKEINNSLEERLKKIEKLLNL